MKHELARKYLSNLKRTNQQLKAAHVFRPRVTKFKRVCKLHKVYSYFYKRENFVLIQTLNSLKMMSDSDQSSGEKPAFSKVSSINLEAGKVSHEVVLSKIRQFLRKFAKFKNVDKLVSDQKRVSEG